MQPWRQILSLVLVELSHLEYPYLITLIPPRMGFWPVLIPYIRLGLIRGPTLLLRYYSRSSFITDEFESRIIKILVWVISQAKPLPRPSSWLFWISQKPNLAILYIEKRKRLEVMFLLFHWWQWTQSVQSWRDYLRSYAPQALILKIQYTLSTNQKRDSEFNVW